jgi:hypothetical protein
MSKLFFPIGLAVFSSLVSAQAPRDPATQTIIVTGVRIQDYRDRLAACLARNCAPNEDIDATLALAEAHFVNGEYRDARRTILASLSRNQRHRRAYAEPVSDLHRANSRVARHLGLDRSAEYSTWEVLRILRAGLPEEDHRHFSARLEVAQSLARFGYRYHDSQRQLRELIPRARAAGRDDVVAMAELRILWLDYLQSPYRSPPSAAMLAMARSSDPRRAVGARMMLARIYSRRGETARADALIAELGRSGQRRQLIYSPPYELAQQEDGSNAMRQRLALQGVATGANLVDQLVDNFDDKWIEVGFWVRPDGRVEGLEVVRQRNNASWARPLVASIRERRYAPGETSTYRLERYTYTSGYRDAGGSHMQRRSPSARVEYFDLSEGATPPPRTSS